MKDLLIRNGMVVDPSQGLEAVSDLLIRDGDRGFGGGGRGGRGGN